MQRKGLCCLTSLLLLVSVNLWSQHNTSSPYSMFGVGIITPGDDVTSAGMGGAGIAMPSGLRVNNLNPASLTEIDSMTFLMDAQLKGFVSYSGTSSNYQKSTGINFDAISFGFKVKNWWGCEFGLNTYSQAGYSFTTSSNILGSYDTYNSTYSGNGGLTQLHLSNGVRLFPGFSLGLNASYIWGELVSNETADFENISGESMTNARTYNLNNFYFSTGMQYQTSIGQNYKLFLGAVANNKTKMVTDYNQTISDANGSAYIDKDYSTENFYLPAGYGFGLGLSFNNTFKFTADYRFNQWSDAPSPTTYAKLDDSHGFNGGVEFSPQKNQFQSVFYRMKYRAGGFYRNTYLNIKGNDIIERGVTAGLSIPLKQNRNFINLAYEYKIFGTNKDGLIKENINTVKIGLLLSETWFYKSKFE